jgi:hypothetical protein
VQLSTAQAAALDSLCGHRRESAADWGKHELASMVVVEPEAFSNRFCLTAIEAAERLNKALADDLGASEHSFAPNAGTVRAILRYRWLAGLPSEGFFSG